MQANMKLVLFSHFFIYGLQQTGPPIHNTLAGLPDLIAQLQQFLHHIEHPAVPILRPKSIVELAIETV